MLGGILKRYPFFIIFFAAFPVLALFAHNVLELELRLLWRPLLISVGWMLLLWGVLSVLLRKPLQATILTALIGVLFYSYGHVYDMLRAIPDIGILLGRHRYLTVLYVLLLTGGAVLIWRVATIGLNNLFSTLNLIGLVLLIYPTYQVFFYQMSIRAATTHAVELTYDDGYPLLPPSGGVLPDIYFVVLDGYMRADALMQDMDFDNSEFLNAMRDMGFYVVPCSRSNYGYTMGSLLSTLNMTYLTEVAMLQDVLGIDTDDIWLMIRHSLVRRKLEALGYQSVGFETGYEWTRMADADIFLGRGEDPLAFQRLTPFEAMLIKTTAGLILVDSQSKLLQQSLADVNYPYKDHIDIVTFVLDQLPLLAKNPAPTFVFAHILVPHVPYVFQPDGSLTTDPNYYSGPLATAVNDKYERLGYLNSIQFINSHMEEIFAQILADSETPPIIFVMGDHGLKRENRHQILSLYYLPGITNDPNGNTTEVYETITPVNAFRLIFNRYFGTDYPFVVDLSFGSADLILLETSPACLTNP
jgi:hypothetical protein